MTCQVEVLQGTLQGEIRTSYDGFQYYAFEGIPYAKPPVGTLRFRNPVEPESWTGVRDATKPGNKCAQINPYSSKSLEGSEDCLYLNVYTPSLPVEKLEKLPVLFFVHGGRLLVGYGDYYQPDYFIKQNVILVTCNYRLNILGFLALKTPEAPGNVGCKDTVMALKWVNKNIGRFNGDYDNITAFGESAGSGIVTAYLTTKMTDGLVHKIIGQSGVSLSDLFIIDEDPIAKAMDVASILGKTFTNTKDLYEFMMEAPIEDLVFAFSVAEINRPPTEINAYFTAIVEEKFDGVDQFFHEYPLHLMREKRFKNLPLLLGLSSHEGAPFVRKDENGKLQYEQSLNLFVPKYHLIKLDSPDAIRMGKKIHNHYFKGKEINDKVRLEYVNLVSDTYFVRDIMHFVDIAAKCLDNLYLYRFSYNGNMSTRVLKNLDIKGATHGDIVQYQFYRKAKHDVGSAADMKIVDFLVESWCNFARNGKPTWRNQRIEWIPYKDNDRKCLNIDEEITLDHKVEWNPLEFWKSLGRRSKL